MSRERQIGKCPFNKEPCRLSFEPEYIKRKAPVRDSQQRLVVAHAPEIAYECASCLWQEMNDRMDAEIDRTNAQIVVLTPHEDVTGKLYDSLQMSPLGKYPVATTKEQRYGDGELDLNLVGEAPHAQSVYVVSSIQNEIDFIRAMIVADHYKSDLNANRATLICPFMTAGRQDKNTDSKSGSTDYLPTTINIRSYLKAIDSVFDRAIIYEPHSSATQYFASETKMPVFPLSPWQLMIDNMIQKGIKFDGKRVKPNKDNAVFIGPDKGRNLTTRRSAEYLGFEYVSFNKRRISGEEVEIYELTEEEQEKIRGKIAIGLDDEGSSFKTVRNVARALDKYGALVFGMNIIHPKCTGEWVKNIHYPLLTTVFVSDSRQPVGNINMASDIIERVSLMPSIREVINADLQGINFWEDRHFQSMILQPYGHEITPQDIQRD